MFLDWLLASFHHLAVFSLAGILAIELALTASFLDDRTMLRLAHIDAWFGLVAAIVVGAGLLRIFFAAKGFDYYVANTFFWIKMALFVAVGVISTVPTFSFIVWRRGGARRCCFSSTCRGGLPDAQSALRRGRAFRADSALRHGDGARLRHVTRRFSRSAGRPAGTRTPRTCRQATCRRRV
jgi:putative membrane protein